ncbi:Serine/threonine protein kinase [Handroanthus impetiginosus]|uniref:Receptor-like serine/threonine-protein kinase n=1 Tax=Handroanthus impetiginosus TaxID=429701 RepID=A0A2G9HBA6_9LAMI|nr:Serine/threonine protein kinase [Handroanthus impetiginosus]
MQSFPSIKPTMNNTKNLSLFLPSLIFMLSFPFHGFCLEKDTMNSTSSINDPDSLISSNHVFKFGFFTTNNTTNRYLGVFYAMSEKTVVWVANKDKPLKDSSGIVTISKRGELVLKNGKNETVWSTNTTTTSININVQIQDTGNLVLRNISTENTIWESFAHPSSVFLPTMRIIDNIRTGYRVGLSSWKNESDPELGSYTASLQAENIPQIVIWNNGRLHWRSGPWNVQILIGFQDMYSPYLDSFRVVNISSETFYFTALPGRVLMRISLNPSGTLEQTLWDDQRKSWDSTSYTPRIDCDFYGKCGPFGICNAVERPICSCLRGFEPENKEEWGRGNWTSGCVRRKELECDRSNSSGGSSDGFLRLQFMKVPDFPEQFAARFEDECRSRCLKNCSCIAYAHDPYIGCMFWSDRLIDMQKFSGIGPNLYVRLAASELGDHKDKKLIIIIPMVVAFVFLSICAFIAWHYMARRKGDRTKEQKTIEANQTFSSDSNAIVLKDESEKVNIQELPLFTFETLANATNQFHDDNMLGKGGFGPVYMGKLANGKEIAVKRLSAASGQGVEEFMNEVIVISKLQHRNLVRLYGCCAEKEEKMLIYEYMPNKSLDLCLFDPTHPSQKILDWKKRFSIIEGIGRGLIYLHKDSRLRIIHRDLKLSNVLLDEDWNPKISDFGMARIFGGNEDQANTARVVGTYGYMAPEYAMEGRFSEKSDVYSFGVLILEIVSRKKNTHYYNQEWSLSLLGCAWKLWNEDNSMAFVDQMITSLDFQREIVRCIHIALLCVQEFPKDRPGIQTVLSMLNREIVDLPMPEEPVFAEKWNRFHVESTQPTSQIGYSINELTITELNGR